jgi:hypothetical protein
MTYACRRICEQSIFHQSQSLLQRESQHCNIVWGFGLCGAGGLAKEPHRCLKRAEWVTKTTRVHARVEESDIGGYRMYWQLSNATRVRLLICIQCISSSRRFQLHCTALHCTALHYCASTASTRREVHRLWAAQHALWPLGSIVAHVRALLKLSVGNVEDLDSRRTCVTLRHACTCCVCSDCSGLQHSSERQSGTSPL